tara:strand:- start:550 stop:966 length:417 start_codon:yes stop_codon:yes gene_type:complete
VIEKLKKLLLKKKRQPKAHIDSSIFIEILFNQPRAEQAQTLIRTAGMKNKPLLKVSSTVLGEIVKVIDREEDDLIRDVAYEYLDGILSRRNILIHTPGIKALRDILPDIYQTNNYIESMDLSKTTGQRQVECSGVLSH